MSFRYPNGKLYNHSKITSVPSIKQSGYANRGMTLEDNINESNDYYLHHNIAVIHKKPTPVQIVKVDYPKRSAAVIKEAYFKQASTTDYNGIFQGRYIDFEAKETRNKTSFPLHNFHEHQIAHMNSIINQDGICFVILCFSMLDEIYLLEAKHLVSFWNRHINGGRKSIKREEIASYGHLIKIGLHPRIDYIKIIKAIYF